MLYSLNMSQRLRTVIFFYTIFFTAFVFLIVSLTYKQFGDEGAHFQIIDSLVKGTITSDIFSKAAVFPGYFVLVAFISKIFHIGSPQGYRFISFFFGICSVVMFYVIAKRVSQDGFYVRTLQYFFLPIVFPFFFLLYTDLMSVLFVLIAFYMLLKGRYFLSGIVVLLAVLVRQNNLLWILFFWLYLFLKEWPFRDVAKVALLILKRTWVYLFPFFIFVVFLIADGGSLTVGSQGMHPFSFHFGNIFFALLLYFFLFLPLHISNLKRIVVFVKLHLKVVVLFMVIGYLIYMFGMRLDHPWNLETEYHYIRNDFLQFVFSTPLIKSIFFLPIVVSVLSLFVTKLIRKEYYAFYPIAILVLSAHWLIEPRYSIIPFVFFLLFSERRSVRVEYATVAFFALISFYIFPLLKNATYI